MIGNKAHRLQFFCFVFLMVAFWSNPAKVFSQARIDSAFTHQVVAPLYPEGKGTEVYVDNAHQNYHTASGRYMPFANLLRSDGYQIKETNSEFSDDFFRGKKILVISNALHPSNAGNWSQPVLSAFSIREISAIVKWVNEGGSLFLIADHMPFGGAASELAKALGFEMCNCFAMDNRHRDVELFSLSLGNLLISEVNAGLNVDTVATFTGSAFKIPENASGILRLNNYTILSPVQAWVFEDDTPFESGDDYYQLATLELGKGRIVLSGEAAMFTSQISGDEKIGLSNEAAKDNIQLLLNIVHWLDRK